MVQRSKRGYIKTEQVLTLLEHGRNGAVQVCTQAHINSVEYRLAGEVITKIDDLTGELTGDRTYFHIKMHSS